jgi:hypothetical protein
MASIVRPWNPPLNADDAATACIGARNFDRVLDGLGTGRDKHGFLVRVAGCQFVELLRKLHSRIIWRNHDAGMAEPLYLVLDRCNHPRV